MQSRLFRLNAALVCALLAAPAVAAAAPMSRAVEELYASVSIFPPTASRMTVCYAFVCRRRHILDFTPADRAALSQIMAAGRASAAAERAALQKAVVWLDRRMAPILGTDRRVARADFRHRDDAHNYDCWDITRNTTSLLLVLSDWGLLKHHAIGDPRYRGNALVLQTPHNTAVLIDKATRQEWVLDLWTRAYAQSPDVMPVDKWLKED